MDDIIVFGCGTYFEKKRYEIEKKYKVVAFLDNAVKKTEVKVEEKEGIPIYNPQKINELPECPIILMSVAFFAMWEQLVKLGVKSDRIVFGSNLLPVYNKLEELLLNTGRYLDIENDCVVIKNKKNLEIMQAKNEVEYQSHIRNIFRNEYKEIDSICGLGVEPISRRWGREHGTPIDRYYIESFLQKNQDVIHGDVMEVADNTYTMRYGSDITNSYILHVNGWGDNVIKGDLESGVGIPDNKVDCFICTQTIQFIYDISSVVSNIYRMLKPGGTALITAHGIAQISMYDYLNWGEYWRFTKQSLEKLFMQNFEQSQTEINSFGNVKIATALLYGLSVEDLEKEEFQYNDEQYPVLLTIKANK